MSKHHEHEGALCTMPCGEPPAVPERLRKAADAYERNPGLGAELDALTDAVAASRAPAGPEMPEAVEYARMTCPRCDASLATPLEELRRLDLEQMRAILAAQGLRIVTEDEVACHRQHEQCMKLLERCFCYLPKCKLEELVIEMLSKGELPEGWDK